MPQVILAFDYGTRRIGVASGDTLTRTARALTTLERNNEVIPWSAIDKLVREYQPAQLVVGLPWNMDGTPTLLTESSRTFAAELKARYNMPVALVDERLSSREAESQLRDARASGLKKRRNTHADVDMIAARILLEQWLENPGAAEQSI
ncbi:MAG TPA: Holliday junction resolvase RuvX [Steroidobacter sp.]|uniref:Holliday junction resolvase RuvX n=1 Tax=Steroidobacter sp. TaxID=1978227 RepID=UPI002EDA7958